MRNEDQQLFKRGIWIGLLGQRDPVFDDPAMEAILNASDGTARMINKLCHAALVIGHSQSVNRINADTAMQAINECMLG